MSTQLRLVDPPAGRRRVERRPTTTRRARSVPRRTRGARWNTDWRLDGTARQVGRAGVAAARDALTRGADGNLRQAS